MRFHVLTLFPELIEQYMKTSIMGRAQKNGYITADTVQIREYSLNPHRNADDYPYGGGAGMVMQAQPLYDAWCSVTGGDPGRMRTILLSPSGRTFDQRMAEELAKEEELLFVCGHYEGIDARVVERIGAEPVSVGDYVVTGGELPALLMMDAVARLVPGVLHNADSAAEESFADGLLEYPQYSRPEEWDGMRVPEVLLSGDHNQVEAYRRREAIRITYEKRPELLAEADLSLEELKFLLEYRKRSCK